MVFFGIFQYASAMSQKISTFLGRAALVSGATWGLLLSGCVGDMPHRGAWASPAHNKKVLLAYSAPDEYLYFPEFAIYYNRTQHRYLSFENGVWYNGTEPIRVQVIDLQTSPAVRMAFHDSPMLHHESVVRDYPANRRRFEPLRAPVRLTDASGFTASRPVR